ncbi:MAG: hypothetical protein ACR2OH_12500 [Microthrixaceae bacterium]
MTERIRPHNRRGTALLAATAVVFSLVAGACTTTPPGQTPEQQVQAIITFVEAVRGHQFVTEPVVEFVDPATFEADVLANLAAEEPSIAPDDSAFKALDWIDGSQDLITQYRKAYGGGVVGYYDPVSDVLKVRGTSLTPYRREVIAHELTHALDDQIHDLSGLSSEGLLDSQYLSKLVAIEGSAERVRTAYYNSMSPLEQAQSIQEQLNAGSDPDLLTIPITLLTLTTAPYLRGLTFQNQVIAALGNPAGPDETLTRYPANTEQGFDTSKYLANETATAVPAPPTDGAAPAIRTGEFGPLLLSLVLLEGIVLDTLDPLTDGWAGGSYTTWDDAGSPCVRVDTAWDSNSEAVDVANALVAWGTLHSGAVVEMPSTTDVRLTRCD